MCIRHCLGSVKEYLRRTETLASIVAASESAIRIACRFGFGGIALLTGAIVNVSHPRRERSHLQSPLIVTVCACEAVVGLGPVAAKT
jgi:hypothetical protein